MENTVLAGRRAGFWRRFAALLIDSLIVLIPLQILVAVLFAYTNGAVQGNFGFVINVCGPVSPIPTGLQPPPPEGANQATLCSSSFFGFETARLLTVATVTTTGNNTSSVFQTYGVSADGNVRDDVFDADTVAYIVLLAYLVWMEFRQGQTLGKRLLSIRVVALSNPAKIGVPLGKALKRYAVMLLGVWIMIVALLLVWFLSGSLENAVSWMPVLIAGGLISVAWMLWIVVSVARKTDPIHDRLAGTAVVMT